MRVRRAQGALWNTVGIVLFVILVFPVFWMISTAFKPDEQINSLTPTWFSGHPTLQHFRDAINRPFFWNDLENTLIIVGATVVIGIALAFLAAVALAKYRFTGRKLFIVLVIGIQMLPGIGLVIPLYVVLARYHQVDTLTGVIVTYLTAALPFSVWTLRGFLIGIPKDLEEAAMVDGSTRLGAFIRILLPLVAPGLVATSVFAFITSWNEYLYARLLLNDQAKQTITVWLSYFLGTSRDTDWGALMAASTLTAIPVVIFFLIVQRKIAFGLTAGAVKRLEDMAPDTLDRLAAACLLPSFPGYEAPGWVLRFAERGLGGLTLFSYNVRDPDQLRALAASLPGLLLAIDEEGGDVTRLEWEHGSSNPGNLALGTVDDVELTEAVAGRIAADLADCGIGLNFAPIADVNTNPDNPVIGVRSFGSDPGLVARHVAAFVRGTQAQGVVACAKHFPGHGDTAVDSHLALPVTAGDWEAALEPFHAAIEAGVGSIMTAHLVVPALDDEPATLSRRIITGLLRGELGYDGLVISDALEMRAVADLVGVEEAAVRSIAAGSDALCIGHDLHDEAVSRIHRALVKAVADGRLPAARLEEAAARVHRTRLTRASAAAPSRQIGAQAAARALHVEGRAEPSGALFVIELVPPANIAAGEARHGLAEILDAPRIVLTGPGEPELPPDRVPIVVLRDAGRHPWQVEVAERLTARRPDTILVETGLPGRRPAGGAAYLVTYGAGRANLAAAASALRP